MLLFAIWFVGIKLPQSLESCGLFIISVVLGILIGTQLDLIIGILAFWTVNIWGLRLLRESVIQFCSGALVPLSLYPQWFQEISMFLPFQSMVYVPVSIYTGSLLGTRLIWQLRHNLYGYFSLQCLSDSSGPYQLGKSQYLEGDSIVAHS